MLKLKLHRILLVFMVGVMVVSLAPTAVFGFKGLSKEQQELYDKGVRYFDTEAVSDETACSIESGGGEVSGSGYPRLISVVKAYGKVAMEMQREYGVPWEVVFAQMQKESGTGTAGIAVSGAENNWLGITGTGDAGTWVSPSGRKWAKYSSISANIKDWASTRVLRNGYYDAAFAYLEHNYDLEGFLKKMISVYAPASDGNAPEAYVQDVLSIMNGPVAIARAQMGWPSSAQLARQENIPIGGRQSIGSDVTSSSDKYATKCSGGGDINSMAIQLSYDHRGEYKGNPIAAYDTAMSEVNTRVACTGPKMGDSCDVFVATVYRKTVDKDFPCCGTTGMRVNLRNNSNYQLVVDGYQTVASTADLQPGDILILNGHIMMYVTLEDGSGKIASASYCDRTSDHVGGIYFSDGRGNYDVLRWKGGV
jgi:hypothetical protein